VTVSANLIPEWGRDQILTASLRLAGLVPYGEEADADKIAGASNHLTLAILELQGEDIVLSAIDRETLSLVASTASYALPSETLDIQVDTNGTAGTIYYSGIESPVKVMSRAEYSEIATKTIESQRPSRVFIEKLAATVNLIFWPVPTSSDLTFKYNQVRLMRAMDTGLVTTDLQRVWIPWLTWTVAAGISADSGMIQKAVMYKAWADRKLEKVKAHSNVEQGPMVFVLNHRARNF